MNISERLKTIIDNKKISQYKLAQLSGVTKQTINRIINNDTPNPGKETIQKLAKGLNMTVSELLGEEPTQDYLEGNTDSPYIVVKEVMPGYNAHIDKDHVNDYTEDDLKMAFELLEVVKKYQKRP